jgi:hypothetical protein
MDPFEDDTKNLTDANSLAANVMSYMWSAQKFIASQFEWTPSQSLRSQLTILSRRSNYALFINAGTVNPDFISLPDFCPVLAAAWIG